MTKQVKVRLIPKNCTVPVMELSVPFRQYREGKFSKVWQMRKDWYKMIQLFGYSGYEVVN